MKAYFSTDKKGDFDNINVANAYIGFLNLGWELEKFYQTPPDTFEAGNMLVGYIGVIQNTLVQLGKPVPEELAYPRELNELCGRKIWQDSLNRFANDPKSWGTFIKPLQGKRFDGRKVNSLTDLLSCGSQLEDIPIWCSQPVDIEAEWRCFVRYGEIVDIRPYKGSWKKHFDAQVAEKAVAMLENKPVAFSLDIGVLKNNATVVIELNDGYSIGSYGMRPIDYAKFLSARWYEMVGLPDPCRF